MNPLSAAWREMVILATATTGITAAEITFVEDKTLFPKPESGFYLYANLAGLGEEVQTMRERNLTLLWGKIDLQPYAGTAELPEDFLLQLEAGFESAQAAGVKVIVRASYGHLGPGGDYRTYEDPEIAVIRSHMEQLGPLFTRQADRIAFFEAGFIGPWGEWHTTKTARSPEARRDLYLHLLNHTPRNRMVAVRYPALKQSLFQSADPLADEDAYDGSARARTAHHNDCFLSSANDVGTYNRDGLTMVEEFAYLAADTQRTLFGGETCGLHDRSLPERAIAEMEKLHLSYLNSSYHPGVLQRWRDLGAMDEIERRMGARFVLQSLTVADRGVPGGRVPMVFTLTNRGFASLYNERPAVLVLRDARGEASWRFPLEEIDPRRWDPGLCMRFAVSVTLPEDLPTADYSWHLQLPDPSPRLARDPRFAIRLANEDLWDEQTGENRLVAAWPVVR
ncbi:MAG TPA: DUF4832 domain-containing protein [Verrucomicrobiales bacterium]|nr:DUF4832 domain-containing protein [Verrucomicrobiales bacterium]